jgi:hypothetical protein
MKDILGTPIELGQKVVFGSAGSMCLRVGEIVKVNAKTVMIKHAEYHNGSYSTIEESRRNFDDVVVIK